MATFLICESKKGMSANQLKRMLGVSYKTAWYLCHRIRAAMVNPNPVPLTGVIEADETFIGGKLRAPRDPVNGGIMPGWDWRKNKSTVLGAIERGGMLRVRKATSNRKGPVTEFLATVVAGDASAIYTDELKSYSKIGDADTIHAAVNHAIDEWVRGDVHINSVESAWSLFKRSIVGSYHQLSAKHLDAYLSEFEWRFNNRENPFLFRDTLTRLLTSDNLTYKKLTA